MKISCRPALFVVLILALLAAAPAAPANVPDDATALLDSGLAYLAANQEPDGSWRSQVGISALALASFLRSDQGRAPRYSKTVEKGLVFLLSKVRADGGIHAGEYPTYSTALSMLALNAAGRDEYKSIIARAQKFLISMQADEDNGIESEDPQYGGFSYDGKKQPDLSNTQFALQALRETALDRNDPCFEKAVTFLERLQNRKKSNDQRWASNDGGFVYAPDESKAGEVTKPDGKQGLRSYASMTYAGLLSYIHAGVSPSDDRVRAAYEWITSNYALDENPGMGPQGLFYYYHTFAKTFSILDKSAVEDSGGNVHDWRAELVKTLADLQGDDGSWVNQHSRWMETDPVLVTSYVCLSLSWCLSS